MYYQWQNIFCIEEKTWIGDTRASCHITNNHDGMINVKIINETMHGGSGTIKAMKLAKTKVQIEQVDGTAKSLSVNLLNFVPVHKSISY